MRPFLDGVKIGCSDARMASRRGYHHGDLRRALVEGSIALIADKGVEALTLRGLARRLGVSHAAPQHHFATKEELLLAVAEDGFDELRVALEAAAARYADPFERLQAAGVAYVTFASEHPAHFRVMFGPHIRAARGITDASGQVLIAASREVAAALGEPERARTISTAAWAMVHGLATLWLDGPLAMSQRKLRQRAVEVTTMMMAAIRLEAVPSTASDDTGAA